MITQGGDGGDAKRFKILEKAFKDPMTEFVFFQWCITLFKQTNLVLQREDPSIPLVVHSQLNRFLLQLAGKLMPVTEIKNAP